MRTNLFTTGFVVKPREGLDPAGVLEAASGYILIRDMGNVLSYTLNILYLGAVRTCSDGATTTTIRSIVCLLAALTWVLTFTTLTSLQFKIKGACGTRCWEHWEPKCDLASAYLASAMSTLNGVTNVHLSINQDTCQSTRLCQ